jgi:hypothetical protein
MKKIAGMRGAYKMLGKEGENKDCLLGWVWVHPESRLIPNWCTGDCWFTPAPLVNRYKSILTHTPIYAKAQTHCGSR